MKNLQISRKLIFTLYAIFSFCLFFPDLTIGVTNKYRLTWRDNPSTTMVVGWMQVSGNTPVVYYGTTDHGTNYQLYSHSKTSDRQVNHKDMDHNFARLTGLSPNTAYYFVIRDSDGTSQRFWFKTAPDDPSVRLSIVAGGDSRNNSTPRRNGNKMVAKLRPHAVMFGGDMTNSSTNSEWKEWLDDWQLTIGADGRMIPVIAERGNHDQNPDIVNIFDVPSNDVYYALSLGGPLLRIYTLNSEISVAGNQTSWLSNDLAENHCQQWKMAQYHRPMRPHTSGKSERNDIVSNWEPLFYNYGVKLVVESDAHVAKSTFPIKAYSGSGNDEGFIRDDAKGVTYIGEGCWGAPLRTTDDDKNWTRNSGKFNHFTWVFIDQDKIEVRYVKIDNADNVGNVNDTNIFAMPSNIDIWAPSNGSVVIVSPNPPDPACGGSGPSPNDGIVTSTINSGEDDVEEEVNGLMYINSTDIELVNDGPTKGDQTVGLRFNGIKIPKGSTIENAYIQFTCDEVTSGSTTLSIKGEASDNAATFSTANFNVSSRSTTSANISWSPTAWSSIGVKENTPDLKQIVQEITDRPGWDSLNSMAFIITGTGTRTAFAYEGSPYNAAKLVVEYTNEITVGIDVKKDADLKIRCFPNPADGYFNIFLGKGLKEGKVEIMDITGKVIDPPTEYLSKRNLMVNTGELVPGMYFVSVRLKNKIYTEKILVR